VPYATYAGQPLRTVEEKRATQKAWRVRNHAHLIVYNAKWLSANPDKKTTFKARQKVWNAAFRYIKYGTTKDFIDALFAQQGAVCAICTTDIPGKKGWQIDHDHKTGKIRGVLCLKCNVGLGNLRDDPRILRVAALYLENNK
jgi:hypothetical protein